MSMVPSATSASGSPSPARSSTVPRGRQDFISTLFRLIGMELYKIRYRAMSIVLSVVAIIAVIVVIVAIFLITLFIINSSGDSFLPPTCTQTANSQPCLDHQPTQAEITQAKQTEIEGTSQPLRLPVSLNITVQVALTPFTILIIILAGAIAGGEYSQGTVRLLFTRGPTRTQFFLAKLGTGLVCSVIGIVSMMVVGIILGQLLNLATGITQSGDFFSIGWLGHALLYVLSAILNWFIFAVIAIFFGILGRSSVAGIVGGLLWFLLEPIVGQLFVLSSNVVHGALSDILKAVPDYLIGNNIGALSQNQGHFVFNSAFASLSDLHAVLVLAVYLALFIGLGWLINERRDVTN